jgi:hypothetical protein
MQLLLISLINRRKGNVDCNQWHCLLTFLTEGWNVTEWGKLTAIDGIVCYTFLTEGWNITEWDKLMALFVHFSDRRMEQNSMA